MGRKREIEKENEKDSTLSKDLIDAISLFFLFLTHKLLTAKKCAQDMYRYKSRFLTAAVFW